MVNLGSVSRANCDARPLRIGFAPADLLTSVAACGAMHKDPAGPAHCRVVGEQEGSWLPIVRVRPSPTAWVPNRDSSARTRARRPFRGARRSRCRSGLGRVGDCATLGTLPMRCACRFPAEAQGAWPRPRVLGYGTWCSGTIGCPPLRRTLELSQSPRGNFDDEHRLQ